jgi:ubiquinone/menaquinone biosynthesis C-methylase UbiE
MGKGGRMTHRNSRRDRHGELEGSRLAFWTICLMHDNPLLKYVRDPYKTLREAGVKEGQTVVEVGCGPGFFTIPAARIVGDHGLIHALDVNRFAVDRVKKKIARDSLSNVRASITNAADTGLADDSVDLVFIFGIRYIAGGLDAVLAEGARVLKHGGRLSIEKSRGPDAELTAGVEKAGLTFSEKKGRLFLFSKR